MKIQWNEIVLTTGALWLAAVVGCSSGGTGSNNDTNTNQNANDNSGADVSFPDVSADAGDDSELISISDDGGIGGSFFGGAGEGDSAATISRIEGTTDEDSFVASFDSDLRTDRVTIGDTEITLEYDTDSMFTYSVSRGEETVFSGSGLVAIRTDAGLKRLQASGFRLQGLPVKPGAGSPEPSNPTAPIGGRTTPIGGRTAQRVDPADVAACRDELLGSLAELVELLEDPDAETEASAEFVACLREVDAVRRIASALCTVQLVLAPALEEVLVECASRSDPLRCLNRAVPAFTSVLSFFSTMNVVLIDIVIQIRRDVELCPSS